MAEHRYRLVVDGELSQRYAPAFEGMELSAGHGETELTGAIVDPSHCRGCWSGSPIWDSRFES
jgi:hypothetical protein